MEATGHFLTKLCVIFSFLIFMSAEGSAQTVQPLPPVQAINNGDEISLDCLVTNTGEDEKINWYQRGNVISFGNQLLVPKNGAYALDIFQDVTTPTSYHWVIQISNLDVNRDSGTWSCRLIDDEGDILQEVVTELLQVGPPVITYITGALNDPPLNSDVRLECIAEGQPDPSVTWSRSYPSSYVMVDGIRKGFVRTISNNTLRLNPLTYSHRGEYICSVSNGYGEVMTARTYVRLPYIPEVRATLSHIRVTENGQAVLACVSQAYPATSTDNDVVWTLNGTDVGSLSGNDVDVLRDPVDFYGERYFSRLTISSTGSQQTGLYECRFSNSQGTASATVMLGLEPAIDPNFGAKTEL